MSRANGLVCGDFSPYSFPVDGFIVNGRALLVEHRYLSSRGRNIGTPSDQEKYETATPL